MAAPDGLLIVDKPTGCTSHDVVGRCRLIAGTRKVGHAGTLDPMATGVLVVGVGRATRLLGHLSRSTKAYEATIRLGQSTVSDDAETQIVASRDAAHLSDTDLEDAVKRFVGDLQQVPAAVSAVKVDGQRAHARVRAGHAVVLPARSVRVTSFVVEAVRRSGGVIDLDVAVECSTGTYIRALARDIGADLGVGGHLTALRRTRVGVFGLREASTVDELARCRPQDLPMVTIDDAARGAFPWYVVDESLVTAVRNGRPLDVALRDQQAAGGQSGPVAVASSAGRFLALYEQRGEVAKAVAVFAPA